MISRTLCFAAAVFLLACGQAEPEPEARRPTEPRLDWPQLFERLASETQSSVIEGTEGWLYFTPELRHLAASEYWGGGTEADPLPAILDFKAQLDRAGIELLFVPVPAKAAIYPGFLPGVDPGAQPSVEARVDPTDLAFLERLHPPRDAPDQPLPVTRPRFLAEHLGVPAAQFRAGHALQFGEQFLYTKSQSSPPSCGSRPRKPVGR